MLHDIIITLKGSKILFEGMTPKGLEWVLLYTTDAPVDCAEKRIAFKTACSFKWQAEADGLKVTLNI